jgi:hypothetical protein
MLCGEVTVEDGSAFGIFISERISGTNVIVRSGSLIQGHGVPGDQGNVLRFAAKPIHLES